MSGEIRVCSTLGCQYCKVKGKGVKNRVGIAPILENNVPIRKPWSHEITITNDYAISMNLEEFYLQRDN